MTASIGFVSSIGTCLYAAAWKTTVGRVAARTPARIVRGVAAVGEHGDRGGEVALVDELALDLEERGPRRCRRGSAASARAATIWRQSSEPIEPPAPVTSTMRSLDVAGDRLEVDLDLLAAEHVLDLHRTDLAGEVEVARDELVAGPAASSPGSPRCGPPRRSCRRSSPERDGIAISTSSGRWSRRTRGSSSVVPSTRTPMIREVAACAGRRRRSRSACRRAAGMRCISCTIEAPASPAPTTSTSLPRATMLSPRPLDQRAREQPRARDEREREQEVERGDRARQAEAVYRRDEIDRRGRRRGRRRRRRARPPTCRGSRRSATSGCRSRRR